MIFPALQLVIVMSSEAMGHKNIYQQQYSLQVRHWER